MSLHKLALAADFDPPIIYPASDGEPMAETDTHRNLMVELIAQLTAFFSHTPDVYVSGNLFVYYVESEPAKRVAPDVFVARGVGKHERRIYKLWEERRAPEVVLSFLRVKPGAQTCSASGCSTPNSASRSTSSSIRNTITCLWRWSVTA